MIQETFDLVGQIKLGASFDSIVMLDGDSLEVNIIRDGQRNTILNLCHFNVDDEGARVPVKPFAVQVTIEKGSGAGGEVEARPEKLKAARKPRAARAAKGTKKS